MDSAGGKSQEVHPWLYGERAQTAAHAKTEATIEEFVAPLEIVEFDQAAVAAYGPLRANLERKGMVVGALDLLIAAHAISQGARVVTNNLREFQRIPGLRVENWV